jgi:nucleotide-binding universal stress UspA family protein
MASPQLRILIAVDGAESSLRAVRHVVGLKEHLRQKLEVLLLNVQPPVPTKELLIDGRLSEVRHLEEPLKAHGATLLAGAGAVLKAAGIECQQHVEIGDLAPAIAGFARTHHCEMIVMGTRGLGPLAGLCLGSVANKVVHLSPVPVLLVP